MTMRFAPSYQLMPGAGFRTAGRRSGRIGVPIDGPSGWFVPQNSNDFVSLGLSPPDFLWLCQEASGSLNNAIGASLALPAVGTGHLYQQTVTGWSRKFLGTDGTSAQGWRVASNLLNLAAGQSGAMLMLASVAIPATTATNILADWGGLTGNSISVYAATPGVAPAVLRAGNLAAGGVAVGTVDHGGIDTVHQFLWHRLSTSQWVRSERDDSAAGASTSLAVTNAITGISTHSTTSVPTARYGWFAIYIGTNAEQDWPAYMAALRGG